jgi:apolipoprotein N-acyltransferase
VTRRRAWLLALLGGVLLAASYPPFPLPFLSFVAIVPAVVLLFDAAGDPRRAYRHGFRYGLVSQAIVLYWMIVALWHFTPMAALGYAITVFMLGVFTGGLFWFVTRVSLAFPRVPVALTFPVAWTALEWAIEHLGDVAFPWLGLGTSLADAPVLVQWADIAGARGVTFWLVWCNVMVVSALIGKGEAGRVRIVKRLVPLALSVAAVWGYGAWRERTLPLREVGKVALIQPNIGFHDKWVPERADSEVGTLLGLSRDALLVIRPDLIIWPEAALPYFLTERPQWQAQISQLVRDSHTPILTGGLHVRFESEGHYQTYNAAFLFDSTGAWATHPVYLKHYLVPVVERVPFVPVRWFRALPGLSRWSGGFGRGTELPVYETSLGRFGVIICYESTFEDLPRRYRAEGTDFLVNITNDAWYGRTAATYQHVSHLVLRAIETRMGIARAANSGISELVDPLGHASAQTRLETQAAVTARLRTSDVIPLYVRWGDWVGRLCALATLAGVIGLVVARRRVAAP